MIKDFKAGIKVCQAVLVRVQKVGNSSNGGVFARGMLEDNSGRIAFFDSEGEHEVKTTGGFVEVQKNNVNVCVEL